MFEYLWLPCMATFAAIALSAILFKEFLKRNRVAQIAVEGRADSDSAPRSGPVESAARTCTSPPVNETATSSGHDWEVFLSFRGKDTRAGFTDFLYTSLNSAGIRTFKDDKELRVGEEFAPELLQAIKQSKISIPILSKGYASSAWCLKELARMVECQKTGRQKIMPIFYDVAPSEVRYQTGSYGEALLLHEGKRRFGKETIQEWRGALSAVGEMNGWDLHSQKENRREGEFARKLTQKVFKELKKAHLAESDCLVNVDNHVDVIMEMIGAGTNETRIIGIHGMGGIGKTTIAKIIYNKLADDFGNHCFLSDIREKAKSEGIPFLQNQLISDILKKKKNRADIKDIDEGTQTIKERLSNKKVLLLLDDAEEKKHIDAIVGKRDWLGRGSKIVITTRKKDILGVPEVDRSYELSGMNARQSLQLFSKHAFRRDSPLDEHIDLSKRAIGIAGGLPLALEVIGSLLSLIEKENWDLTLRKWENVPPKDVQSKLKISYDLLDVGQQHIFLDIACLFIGRNKDIVVHFWNEYEYPEHTMRVLQNMSLIKIEKGNRVWMHDQLRDLGREIVREECKREIKEQNRVWNPQEGLNLLRRYKEKKKVQALRVKLDPQQPQFRFTYKDFENLSDLRFLELDDGGGFFYAEGRRQRGPGFFSIEGSLSRELRSDVPPTCENSDLLLQLRWLSWHNIPPTFNVTNFSMEDVVFLDLSYSKITDNWKGWSHMKVMRNLKVLYLNSCTQLWRLPDELGRDLSSLERLSLQGCISLERLPDSIGNLNSLRILVLTSANICVLPRLPESLIELSLSRLLMDTFPDLSNLANLKELHLEFRWRNSDGLVEYPMPRWIGKLSKLESLRLCDCHFVTTSPTDLSLPPQLKLLDLYNCPNLRCLPTLPSSLSFLYLNQCESLHSMEDLSNLQKLSSLQIYNVAIEEIQGLGFLENLRDLKLSALIQLKKLPDLSNLNKLRSLQVSNCRDLVEIQGELPRFLNHLFIGYCYSLRILPDPSSLMDKQGVRISISNCSKLNVETILGYAEKNPRDLQIEGFEQLEILPDLRNLRNSNELTSLRVEICDNLSEIQGELPESLEQLKISWCKSLQKLPDLSTLMGLREVRINACVSLVENLGELPQSLRILQLRNVEIHALPTLPESLIELYLKKLCLDTFPNLSSLANLKKLDLIFGLRDSSAESGGPVEEHQIPRCIGNLTKLESLRLGCHFVTTLPSDLSFLPQLKKLDLRCPNLRHLPRLPSSLTSLRLKCCKSLRSMVDLSNLKNLSSLDIQFSGITEIQGELPRFLDRFQIRGCHSLEKLPDPSSLMGEREVEIVKCSKLNVEAILGYARKNPRDLQIIGFPQLQILPDLRNLRDSNELTSLRVENCDNLSEIQGELPESLEKLDISWCKSLPKLPDLSRLMGLREVRINTCVSLVEIQGEQLPQSLRILQLRNVEIHALPTLPESLIELYMEKFYMDTFPNLSNFTNLEKLDLVFGSGDSDVESGGHVEEHQIPWWIGNLTKLESLRLGCHFLTTLPSDLSFLPQLKELSLSDCPNLRRLPTLPSSLSSLSLGNCKSLRSMEDLSNLQKLSSLRIHNVAIEEIRGLVCLENLRDLQLSALIQVTILPDLSNLNKLTSLQVSNCARLVEIRGELPRFLDLLFIGYCYSLRILPNPSSLMDKQGVRIYISNCSKLNVETILGYARKNPRDLEIEGFEQLQILPDLRNLRNSNELTSLRVENCDNLSEIQGELPESLEKLDISWCKSLLKLPDLSRLMGLREVRINTCVSLVEIQGELPQSLEVLEIVSCHSLQKLPDFSSSTGLRKVEIRRCRKLNVEAISLLCSEKSVEFVGDDGEEEEEAEYEGEDAESESEYEGEDAESESEYEGEDTESESEYEGEDTESEYEE